MEIVDLSLLLVLANGAMHTADQLVPIPRENWPKLRDLFKDDWPSHEVPYNTIQSYLHWVEIDPRIRHLQVLSLNGTWRENGTYVIVDRYQIYTYTLELSCDSLKRALLLVDWDYSYVITSLRKCLLPALDEVINHLKLEILFYDRCFLYHIPKEEATRFEMDLPPGMYLRKLGVDDAIYGNNIYPQKHEGSEYLLKRLASWNVSVGLFNEAGAMLAWSFHRPNGCIGPLEVHPDHYRKGYGTIIAKAIAKEIARSEQNCYGTIFETNNASMSMFSKLGFSMVDEHYFVRNRARKLCEWSG